MKSQKKLFYTSILILIISMAAICSLVIVIDPFLHFHAPLNGLEYPLKEERYVNDGIQRHYDYEIMVTGTSMSQNINPSLIEELSGKKTIKTAYSGASCHELALNIENAIRHNDKLDTVICSFDPNFLNADAYTNGYDDIPDYIYDDNIFNDVKYIFNKDVILETIAVLNYTRAGNKTPSMDQYGRFDTYRPSGKDAVFQSYVSPEESDEIYSLTDLDKEVIRKNMEENFARVARENPDVSFVFFIPPYSYCYWDVAKRTGQLNLIIDTIEFATEYILDCNNVSVYSFAHMTEITSNLDNYSDTIHYNGWVCDKIMSDILLGNNRIEKGKCNEYFAMLKE